MSALADDWRADLDDADAALIDGFQSGFPIEERPFRAVGTAIGVSEAEALSRVERLRDRGVFRRFGAVLNPPVIGSSTLAAVRAPEDEERFDAVADVINGYRQVNHNYRRDHAWWSTTTASPASPGGQGRMRTPTPPPRRPTPPGRPGRSIRRGSASGPRPT